MKILFFFPINSMIIMIFCTFALLNEKQKSSRIFFHGERTDKLNDKTSWDWLMHEYIDCTNRAKLRNIAWN